MNPTDLLDGLRLLLPGVPLDALTAADQPTIGIQANALPASGLVDACRWLRDERGYAFLVDITAVDWWPRAPRFEVVYHLASAAERLRLKVLLPADEPHLSTVQSIWPAADWLEREVWDMFGIVFDGHGDLRRLLMPEDWEGFPLRKDSPVQIHLKPRAGEPLQISEEEFRRNVEADKAARSKVPAGEVRDA